MSVVTNQRLNVDRLQAALPSDATFGWAGPPLEAVGSKEITASVDDATLQAAVAQAAAQFVDRDGNRTLLFQRAQAALAVNADFLALGSPTNAQTLAQVRAVTKECSALIRLLLGLLDETSGT